MQAHAAVRRVLWSVLLLACPAAVLVAWLHPAQALAALTAATVLVPGSAVGLLVTGVRWLPPIRPAHARPKVTLRQLLWAGMPAAGFMIAIAESDQVRLRVLDYCGTVLLITCVTGQTLRWWFTKRQQQPVDRKVYELAQNVAWIRQDMGKRDRLVAAALDYAGINLPGGPEYMKKRHLRQVRPEISDDTGPQRAVLGAPLAFLTLAGDV